VRDAIAGLGRYGLASLLVWWAQGTARDRIGDVPLGVGMSLWWWVLIGLAVWFTPAVVAGVMLSRAHWGYPQVAGKHARPRTPQRDGQSPGSI